MNLSIAKSKKLPNTLSLHADGNRRSKCASGLCSGLTRVPQVPACPGSQNVTLLGVGLFTDLEEGSQDEVVPGWKGPKSRQGPYEMKEWDN